MNLTWQALIIMPRWNVFLIPRGKNFTLTFVQKLHNFFYSDHAEELVSVFSVRQAVSRGQCCITALFGRGNMIYSFLHSLRKPSITDQASLLVPFSTISAKLRHNGKSILFSTCCGEGSYSFWLCSIRSLKKLTVVLIPFFIIPHFKFVFPYHSGEIIHFEPIIKSTQI